MSPKFVEFFEKNTKETEESSSIEDFLQERVPSKALSKQLFVPVDCEGMGGRRVVQIQRPEEEGAWLPLGREAVCGEVRFASEALRDANEEAPPSESAPEMDLALTGVPYVPEKKRPFWKRLKQKGRRFPEEEDDSPP